jgi:hypothetical protein
MSDPMMTATELRDPVLLATALAGAGVGLTNEKGDVVITDGSATVTLDLKTGRLTGDVETMRKTLGLVRQLYAEAKYRAECEQQGIEIGHRTIDKQGNIVLVCRMK